MLEAGGYRTLNDIIDLEREDFLKLAGIAPEEADRLMAFINEVTAEGGAEDGAEGGAEDGATASESAAPEGSPAPEPPKQDGGGRPGGTTAA